MATGKSKRRARSSPPVKSGGSGKSAEPVRRSRYGFHIKCGLCFVAVCAGVTMAAGSAWLAEGRGGFGTESAKDGAMSRSAPPAPAMGHSSLTLDESGLRAGERRLTFATLEQWSFAPGKPSDAPEAIRRLDGQEREISGFMFPLEYGRAIRLFCLLKTTQTCCYGPMPQFNQYVLVEMNRPVEFRAARPVTVAGRFRVDPQPNEGFIYRMEGVSVSDAPLDELRVVAQ